MDEDGDIIQPWDAGREVPLIEDEQTPWKMIKLLRIISLFVVAVIVFGLALCSKTSFLILITMANDGTMTIPAEQKPVVLLCIGCSLIASSVLLFLKSIWKSCHKTSKLPMIKTVALVLSFEFVASVGAAILIIVAMPHFDIVTNVSILNSVAILSSLLQVISQCSAKEMNRFLIPSITAFIFLLIGHCIFLALYIMKDPTDTKMIIWVGLAVGGSFLVSFNWWENYFRLIGENSSSIFLKNLSIDVRRGQNILHIISSLLRIMVTACVLGAYVPLSKMDWEVVKSIPSHETRIIAITIGVQLISSVLCHWFAVAACKMHALRRCFIVPLYLASLAVMALLVVPVIVYYQDYRTSVNGTEGTNFTSYCSVVVDGTNHSVNGSVFPQLVMDVTHTLCFLDMSKIADIGMLTGSAVAWWLGLVLATLYVWSFNLYRIQRTQDLLARRLYEGAFIEQSLLLNTRFDIQTRKKTKKALDPSMVYLCATMWHETYDEMMSIILSIFRLDRFRPKEDSKNQDFSFEAHIYFDDAFEDACGSQERLLNNYAKDLVEVITKAYGIFKNIEDKFFAKKQQIPDQTVIMTPYGGRLVVTMPHGNSITIHFKDKELIRHKKRWSQIMYLYYLLGWKLMTKYYRRWQERENEKDLRAEIQKEKHNTYLLALDGDTDFQPAAVMLLIDRLKMYPRVGAACGRIHPTGSGPVVWFQKFEYAIGHWLQKTAEHVIGSVLCSPGCFSLFRAEALMDNNVMKRYSTKSMEASHYVQYDQGEDRWLCTLLLKQGWRVEYNAASDAYTNAPEDFKELYNQRRRWGPSTMANIVDILGSTTMISNRNPSMSKAFMFYQLFALFSGILGPATICLLIAGSLNFVLNIHAAGALVISVIPPSIYLILCFKLKSDTQITIAGVMSIIYAFFMLIVSLSIIGSMVRDKTILTPSSMFVIVMAMIYIVTAIMHPQEFPLVFYGFLYIICIPSAYLLLTIYSMANMNNVSWGTRETKPAGGARAAPVTTPQTTAQKARNIFQRYFACCKCKRSSSQGSIVGQENMIPEPEQPEPQNTIVEDDRITAEEQGHVSPVFDAQSWVKEIQELSKDMQLQEDSLDQEEQEFWKALQEKYLKPLPDDKEKQKKITNDLRELRNKINFAFFMVNAMWLVATFTLQIYNATFAIRIPKVDFNFETTGEDAEIDPIAFMFILGFAVSVGIQFFAMFYHRIYTLIHYIAFLDTVPQEKKSNRQDLYLPGKKGNSDPGVSSDSNSDSSSMSLSQLNSLSEDSDDEYDLIYANMNPHDGTMV